MDTEGGADNIHNRVYCPHLVEVNLINGKAVSLRLCLSHQTEHLSRHAAHILVLQPVKDTVDIVNIAVNMGVVMCMAVIVVVSMIVIVVMAMVMSIAVAMIVDMVVAVVMRVVMLVAMIMLVVVSVTVVVVVTVSVSVTVVMSVTVVVSVTVVMAVTFPVTVQMDVEIVGIDTAFLRPSEMQMISLYSQLFKGLLQLFPGGPQI